MKINLFPVTAAMAMLWTPLAAAAGEPRATELSEIFSAELRQLEQEEARLVKELQTLPALFPEQQTNRTGYSGKPVPRRRNQPPRQDARYIRLDLGQRERIDQIVLVPAEFAVDENPGFGYGFPVRWRIEASDDPAFEEYTVISDQTAADFPNPGRYPVIVPAAELSARYVRLTATGLWTFNARSLLAMGEIMVLQGNRNLAAGLPADSVKVSDADEIPPQWSQQNLVDSQSVLGAPSGIVASRTEGYQSAPAAMPDTEKWVQLDLGEEVVIQEVRLLPARAGEYPSRRGFGFPLRYKVEISSTPDFANSALVADHLRRDVPSPYENPVVVPVPSLKGRHVRLTATRLSERYEDYVLAVAEMQVYSGGKNLAAGAAVTAKDSRETGIWSARFLTDGFSSQRNALDWPAYLAGLERRRAVEARVAALPGERQALTGKVLRRITGWSLAGVGALVALTAAAIYRSRRERRRELEALRQRIARDVHDEIGSGLGTISLLSQMSGKNNRYSENAREDFTEIHSISKEITESLRDIVWLIRPETKTVGDLAQRLRETAGTMLAAVPHEFHAEDSDGGRSLPLESKRQILMFFKEAMHNIIRHSGACRAVIRVGSAQAHFLLEIADEGCGFDPAQLRSGAGLTGMRQRAKTLGGTLVVDSNPGQGTRLRLTVPW